MIPKAILLWITALSIFCSLAGGLESLVEAEMDLYAGLWLLLNVCLVYTCYTLLNYKEAYILSGCAWFSKFSKEWENVV